MGGTTEQKRAWRAKNRDKVNEANRRWRENNPERYQESIRKWKDDNPEKVRAARARNALRTKQAAIEAYGGKCACCGEDRLVFLTIEHTWKNGAEHRKELGSYGSGTRLYRWLKKAGYPTDLGLGVLCFNCQMASFWGVCPHQDEKG